MLRHYVRLKSGRLHSVGVEGWSGWHPDYIRSVVFREVQHRYSSWRRMRHHALEIHHFLVSRNPGGALGWDRGS